MKCSPVVGLVTSSGKTLWLPARMLGMLETMANHPRRLFGRNRPEIMLAALRAFQREMLAREREQAADERRKAAKIKEAS